MRKEYDPLSVIPAADVVKRRLASIHEQARKLKILLKTAQQIERHQRREPPGVERGHDERA